MKVNEYNQMMSYMLRPKNQGLIKANLTKQEKSLQSLIDIFGEDLLNKITQEKFGINFKEVPPESRDPKGEIKNFKRRLLKFKDFIKENNRMPNESEARKLGRVQRDKTIAGTGIKEVTEQDIRNKLIQNNKVAETFKGKIIFANEDTQNKFEAELRKRYSNPRTSGAAKAAGVMSNKEIYEEFLKPAGYKPESARTIIDDYKKSLDLKFKELTSAEKEQKKVERELLDRIITGGRRISGTKKNPAHHMFPLGDEVLAKPKEFTVIPEKINARIAQGNKQLKPLVLERADILNKAYAAGPGVDVRELDRQLEEVNKKAEKVINDHYKKYPEHEGLLNWKKIGIQLDDLGGLQDVRQIGTIGGDYTKWTLPNIDKTILDKNVANLSKEELAGFRNAIKQVDLIRENVTTADKIPTPQKTMIRDMFKDFSTRTSAMPFLDPRAILTGLGDVARFFGTPSVAAAFAGTTIKENLEKGDSLLDAATDKMVGIDLLYPELAKQTVGRFAQPTGKGILSMLGRVAMNPFGRAARAFTPVGAGITAIGLGKDYYDFIQRDLARKAADPEAYAAEQEEQMGMSA